MEKEMTQERINELLEAEAKLRKTRETSRRATQRRNARLSILARKAKEAGLSVSKEEIDEFIKASKK